MAEASQTFFLEDTVCLRGSRDKIGIITRTWHDMDDPPLDEFDPEHVVMGENVLAPAVNEFLSTGQPSQGYVVVAYSSPSDGMCLIHQSELELLDRLINFGDLLKLSLSSSVSGTVTSVSTILTLKHSFLPPLASPTIDRVSNDDVRLCSEWLESDFIVWKNWLGVIEEVFDEVAVRLKDGSVVIVEKAEDLTVPLYSNRYPNSNGQAPEGEADPSEALSLPSSSRSRAASDPPTNAFNSSTSRTPKSFSNRASLSSQQDSSIPSPEHLAPGQYVRTTKGNLRRGVWKFGSYNPSTPPEGYVLGVTTVRLSVNWLCQNIFSKPGAKFISSPRPDDLLELDDLENVDSPVRKFDRVGGTARAAQVGDRVRFRDLAAALEDPRYPEVRKVGREQSLGYDVNTFVVVATETLVDVLWQDGRRQTGLSTRSCVPYLNVDDHDTWPGEIVIGKEEFEAERAALAEDSESPAAPGSLAAEPWLPSIIQSTLSALTRSSNSANEVPKRQRRPSMDNWYPRRVGVVQSMSPAERLATVKWFQNPSLEVARAGPGNAILVAGGKTGELEKVGEEVSVYEVSPSQAIGVARGEMVLIMPDPDELTENPHGGHESSLGDSSTLSMQTVDQQLQNQGTEWTMSDTEGIMRTADRGLLANFSANLQGSANPQFQSLGRLLSTVGWSNGTSSPQGPGTPVPRGPAMSHHVNEDVLLESWRRSVEWIGEVIDLGLDGRAAVRLGALDVPRVIHVAVERLRVVYNDNIGAVGDEDDLDTDYDYAMDDDNSEAAFSDAAFGELEDAPAREEVFYEGGQPLDSQGGEDDWMTDDDGDVEMDLPPPHLDEAERAELTRRRHRSSFSSLSRDQEHASIDLTSPEITRLGTLPGSYPISPSPENGSAIPPALPAPPRPEAFTLSKTCTDNVPSRFAILEVAPPADHAFVSQPSITFDAVLHKRLLKEHRILASALPEGIFVRTWESRLDLLRVLIVGPLNTPYELAPFVFDFYLGGGFPTQPPKAYFHSWTDGIGRVNPNLYEDGKICLSLLGTWQGEERSEHWVGAKSSLLQVLVSLMGLVLVHEPYYNEAGFNVFVGSADSQVNSALYSEKAYILARGFVKHVLTHTIRGLDDVIKWLYVPDTEDSKNGSPDLLSEVLKRGREVESRSEQPASEDGTAMMGSEGVGRVTRGALVLLKRNLEALQVIRQTVKTEGESSVAGGTS